MSARPNAGGSTPLLHAEPARAAEIEYVRLYTGFCRRITVTQADLERLKGGGAASQCELPLG